MAYAATQRIRYSYAAGTSAAAYPDTNARGPTARAFVVSGGDLTMSAESLDAIAAAIQAHVNESQDDAWMVDNAVLGAELVGFDEDGTARRRLIYLIPTDNFSISGGLGLLEGMRHYMRRDALGADAEH